MLRRLSRLLVFAIEAALPMHARPPESVRRTPRRFGCAGGSSGGFDPFRTPASTHRT